MCQERVEPERPSTPKHWELPGPALDSPQRLLETVYAPVWTVPDEPQLSTRGWRVLVGAAVASTAREVKVRMEVTNFILNFYGV